MNKSSKDRGGYRQLGTAGTIKLAAWLKDNPHTVAGTFVEELVEKAKQDTGVEHLTVNMMRGVLKEMGLEPKSRRQHPRPKKGGVDRAHIVAVALRDLYDHLKLPVPPLLKAVVERKSPEEQKP